MSPIEKFRCTSSGASNCAHVAVPTATKSAIDALPFRSSWHSPVAATRLSAARSVPS